MTIHELEESLKTLAIPFEQRRALLALPLAYVAWADGQIEPAQTSAIQRATRETFTLSAEGQALVWDWLQKRPTAAYFRESLRVLKDLSELKQELELPDTDLHRSLLLCGAITRLGADSSGAPETVTPEQREALQVLAKMLNLENTKTWANMRDALDGRAPSGSAEQPGAPRRDRSAATGTEVEAPLRRHRARARQAAAQDPLEPPGGIV